MNAFSKKCAAVTPRDLWTVTAMENDTRHQFTVGTIDFSSDRIKEILTEIYPHYSIISVVPQNEGG